MKGREWTRDEEAYLKEHYPREGCKPVARHLGRSENAVKLRASRLGLDRRAQIQYHRWTTREILFLEKWYPLKGGNYVAAKLGISPKSVRVKARNLNIKRKPLLKWSRHEKDFLWQWYGKIPTNEIARRLKRTPDAVRVKARQMHLRIRQGETWNHAELAYLREQFDHNSYAEIAEVLNKSVGAVQHRANRLGLKKRENFQAWTLEEETNLRRWYQQLPVSEIARKLGRSRSSVLGKARMLGIQKQMAARYTPEEKQYLRDNYFKKTNRKLALDLGRSRGSVELQAKKLGMTGKVEKIRLTRAPAFTEQESAYLREHYLHKTNKQLAEELDRSVESVQLQAQKLGLTGTLEKRRTGDQALSRRRKRQWQESRESVGVMRRYTRDEIDYLQRNYYRKSAREMAQDLNRSPVSIKSKIRQLGLNKMVESPSPPEKIQVVHGRLKRRPARGRRRR